MSNAWIDDLRIHPVQSLMETYSYEPVYLRLNAKLDPNNYAQFFEYSFSEAGYSAVFFLKNRFRYFLLKEIPMPMLYRIFEKSNPTNTQ